MRHKAQSPSMGKLIISVVKFFTCKSQGTSTFPLPGVRQNIERPLWLQADAVSLNFFTVQPEREEGFYTYFVAEKTEDPRGPNG